jgi:hypothetical protein
MPANIAKIVQNAFKTAQAAAGVLENITYQSVELGAYNPTTDDHNITVTEHQFEAALARFKASEVYDDVIVTSDFKCLFPALNLPVDVSTNDRILVKGKTYEVRKSLGVPGESLHILHIREV